MSDSESEDKDRKEKKDEDKKPYVDELAKELNCNNPSGPSSSVTISTTSGLTLGTIPFTDKYRLANHLIQKGHIKFDDVDAFVKDLGPLWDKGRTFENAAKLLEAMEDNSESSDEDEYDYSHLIDKKGKVTINTGIWLGEHEKFKTFDFTAKCTLGDSVRSGHSLDYQSSDKDAFAVVEDDNVVLVVRLKKPPGAKALKYEVKTLQDLGEEGLPVITIIKVGYVKISGKVCPAMLMPKMSGSSKSLMRQSKKGTVRVEGYELELLRLFPDVESCKIAISSLDIIASMISKKPECAVDDIQFLISPKCQFLINDASEMGNKFLGANLLLIADLIDMLKEHLQKL